MNQKCVHVGIDVSKAILDIDPFDGKSPQVKNTASGINSLIQRINSCPHKVVVCCEASGGYEKLLCGMLPAAGIEIACVNAFRVRKYAESKRYLCLKPAQHQYRLKNGRLTGTAVRGGQAVGMFSLM